MLSLTLIKILCCIKPVPGYIEALRTLTSENDIVLIFDEVLSGFRMGPGCAQAYLGVTPDLTTLAKAVAGGVPLSVFCGKKEIMQQVLSLIHISEPTRQY